MENDYRDGYPNRNDFFDCLVEGEQVRLYHFKCVVNGKHTWYLNKKEEIREKVLWKEISKK